MVLGLKWGIRHWPRTKSALHVSRLTKANPATAQRDLADLVGGGMLALIGGGRGARYELQWTTDT